MWTPTQPRNRRRFTDFGRSLVLERTATFRGGRYSYRQMMTLPRGATEDVIPEDEWRALERTNIMRALERARYQLWGKGGAADLLGINAATLASRLRKLGIRASELKRRSA